MAVKIGQPGTVMVLPFPFTRSGFVDAKLGENYFLVQPLPASNSRWWSGNIGTDVIKLIDKNPGRLALTIVNHSAADIYLSANRQDVVARRGFVFASGESIAADSYLGDIYAVAAVPNCPVSIIEMFT